MAFFIAESPKYVTIRPEKLHYSKETGQLIGKDRELWLKMRRREAPPWAREIGKEVFAFNGYPMGVDPLEWMAFIDTEDEAVHQGWSDEELAVVDKRMRGIEGVVEVFKPQPTPPWPNYLSLSVEQNIELARKTGVPIDDLLEFERAARGNTETLERYERLLGTFVETEAVVEA